MRTAQARRRILGVSIDPFTMEEALDVADQAIRRRQSLQIGVVNAAKVVNMHRNPQLRQAVQSSDMILADGMSVVWASRLLRQPLPERITGCDLMIRLFELGNRKGYRVYCLGATDEVLNGVLQRLRAEYPHLQVAGCHNGYFSLDQEAAIAEDIAVSKPDMLFVAITSPKKEQFLARWSHQIRVPICHGVGGSFDVFAGKTRRAPDSWQRAGMEWAYRLLQEPGRMWRRYLVTNALFACMLWHEWITPTPLRKAP